jgi:hypothetical protein
MIVLRLLALLAGVALVLGTVNSAIRTFVLPGSAPDLEESRKNAPVARRACFAIISEVPRW